MKLVHLCTLLLGTAALLLPAVAQSPPASPSRPANILLIVGDDIGYADLGFNGCRDIPTPHLDALAASGVRFTNGYVTGPYCSPTRAALLTGRYQNRFGHEFNPSGPAAGMPVTESTLADRLKAAGYTTGLVGKWHLGSASGMLPQQRGFDEFLGFLGGAHSYTKANGILRGTTPVTELDYTTDAFAREAASFINRHRATPWMLYLAFNAVHTPLQATGERLTKLAGIKDPKRRTYAAMMLALDDAIGTVLNQLRATGQEGHTLVCFISDNGGPAMKGVTVNGAINTPLRGGKRTTLEGGIRVPFLISWPGKIKPAVFEKPVIQLDLHATALAAAGLSLKTEWKLEGVNLLPLLDDSSTPAPHDALYWRFGNQMAVRSGDFKLVRYDLKADTAVLERSKLNQGVGEARLYNLKMDLGENNDLAAAQPEKVRELQALWDTWNQHNLPPLAGASPERGNRVRAQRKKERRAAAVP